MTHASAVARRFTARQLAELFTGFRCEDQADAYAQRDALALQASEALLCSDLGPVAQLQSFLRAALAIALASELPTATWLQSADLWRRRVRAAIDLGDNQGHTDARAKRTRNSDIAELRPPIPPGELVFDLTMFEPPAYRSALLQALSLAPFRSRGREPLDTTYAAIQRQTDVFPVPYLNVIGSLRSTMPATEARRRFVSFFSG